MQNQLAFHAGLDKRMVEPGSQVHPSIRRYLECWPLCSDGRQMRHSDRGWVPVVERARSIRLLDSVWILFIYYINSVFLWLKTLLSQ